MKENKKISSSIQADIILCTCLLIVLSFWLIPEVIMAGQPNLPPTPGGAQHNEYRDNDRFSPGPHQDLACSECHKVDANARQPAGELVQADSVQLCLKCHPDSNIHPIGIKPAYVTPDTLSAPLSFGDDGEIICLTCHAIHLTGENAGGEYLLRGTQETFSLKRTTLCLTCHPDRFQGKSPHDQDEKSCGFCHIALPDKEKKKKSPPDEQLQASCDLCHVELSDTHYAASNPFIDDVIHELAMQSAILPASGQPACSSCHEYHGHADGRGILDPAYMKLCNASRSIDPHWNDTHCLSCHDHPPKKGEASLQYDGNINTLCNHCHHSDYARSDIHPVGIKPSKHVRIPDNMPLQDGRLTCTTCHDPSMQAGCLELRSDEEINELNLFFLRGKEKSRTSFCFLCHFEETYKRLNPHKQVNEQGKILEETCLFCHASIPDVGILGPEKVSFIVQNPDAYCIGCHHGFTSNHPAGIDHLKIPSAKIMKALNTSIQRIGVELPLYKGKIVCATCHNPHQAGVIKFSAAATGAKRGNKLRLKPGRMQCVGCHWDKR